MPPRNPELPEGTDHIINGALDTSNGSSTSMSAGADTGLGGPAMGGGSTTGEVGDGTGMSGGGASSGFVGGNPADDTGGTSLGSGGDIKTQLRDGAAGLQQQAGDKIRAFADTGKGRATTALDDFSQMVSDAAGSIDERLGAEYGEYARRAADTVSGFADTLRNKDVDELFEDGKALVRKSPGVALGVAAVVGFTLVRLVKAGLEAPQDGTSNEVQFEPSSDGAGTGTGTGTAGTATTTSTGA